MPRVDCSAVSLMPVDEGLLDELVSVATGQASADEVTPSLGAGPAWSPERVAWLRGFHRGCRGGLDGPAAEASWAVLHNGRVVGSVRLKRTEEYGVLETGIWLIRGVRAQGIGTAAMTAVLRQARDLGARQVRASTTADNAAALGALRRPGFHLVTGDDAAVTAVLTIDSGDARGATVRRVEARDASAAITVDP